MCGTIIGREFGRTKFLMKRAKVSHLPRGIIIAEDAVKVSRFYSICELQEIQWFVSGVNEHVAVVWFRDGEVWRKWRCFNL